MKTKNHYSKFVLNSSATTCVYGNKIISSKKLRRKISWFKRLGNFIFYRMNV